MPSVAEPPDMPDAPWHGDPSFWETLEGLMFPPEKLEAADEELDALCALAGVEAPCRVLDVPCGVGRYAVELADRGFDVTGVDATAAYLDTARQRADEAGVDAEFVEADMREFVRPDTFDLVVNAFTSFGYFEDRDDDRRTARNFYESLRPGGRLVMSLTSKEVLAGKFRERTWSERDGTYLLEEHEVRDDWSWIENRWVVVDDGDVREFEVSHRLYSARELSELLRDVGFDEVEVYGDREGAEYDQNAEHLVVVARK
jgi:SAM-dependent methyltransferase